MKIAAHKGPRSLTRTDPRFSLEAMLAEAEPRGIFVWWHGIARMTRREMAMKGLN